MKLCQHCHGTTFECIDGNYFCENCNTQLPFIYEQYSDDVGFSQVIPSSSKDIAEKYFDKGLPWTFHEAFLTLLLKQCNQLVDLDVPPDFKSIVFNLFKVFLSKQNIAFTSNPTPGPSPHLRDIAVCIQNLDLQTTKKFLLQLKKSNINPMSCEDTSKATSPLPQKKEFDPQTEPNDICETENQTNYDVLFKDIIMEYEAVSQADPLSENNVLIKLQPDMNDASQPQNEYTNGYCTSFMDEIDPNLIDIVLKNKAYKYEKKIKNLLVTQRLALVHNLCFVYLGLLFIKCSKYQLSHLLRLIKEHKLAYFGSSENLPSHMKFMLYDNQILIHKSIPLTKLIRSSCFQLCNIMGFTTKIPKPNLPSIISMYANTLCLPAEFTAVALMIYTETQITFPSDGAYSRFEDPPYNKVKISRLLPNFEGQALAYLYVALKLVYHSHFTQTNLMPRTSASCFGVWWRSWVLKIQARNLIDLASLTLISPHQAYLYISPTLTQNVPCPCQTGRQSFRSQNETDLIIPPSGTPSPSTMLGCPTPQLYTAAYASALLSNARLMSNQSSLTTLSTKYISGRPAFKARLSSAFDRLVPNASDPTLEYNSNPGYLESNEILPTSINSEPIVNAADLKSLASYSPCFVVGSAFDRLLGEFLANKETHDRLPNANYFSQKRPFKLAFQQFFKEYIGKHRSENTSNPSPPYSTILFELMASVSEQSLEELLYDICVVEKRLLSTKFVANTTANS